MAFGGRLPDEPDIWKGFLQETGTVRTKCSVKSLENLNQLAGRVIELNQNLEDLMKEYNISLP